MAIILFYTSLILIVAMITIKYFGVSPFTHKAISSIVSEQEKKIHQIAADGKELASKIQFKNFHRLVVAVASFIKKESIYLKRRFDSQQPKFFLKQQKLDGTHKNSVSFFLRSVSEHKNSLKKKDL